MKKIVIGLVSFVSLNLPALVFAQEVKTRYITSLINGGLYVTRGLLIFLISLAVVWFIWNVIRYSMSSEEDGKEKAKDQMIHGIIAIAVIVSIWGIVAILQSTFGVTQGTNGIQGNFDNMIPGGSSGSINVNVVF